MMGKPPTARIRLYIVCLNRWRRRQQKAIPGGDREGAFLAGRRIAAVEGLLRAAGGGSSLDTTNLETTDLARQRAANALRWASPFRRLLLLQPSAA
jgi:hypothetical protein